MTYAFRIYTGPWRFAFYRRPGQVNLHFGPILFQLEKVR